MKRCIQTIVLVIIFNGLAVAQTNGAKSRDLLEQPDTTIRYKKPREINNGFGASIQFKLIGAQTGIYEKQDWTNQYDVYTNSLPAVAVGFHYKGLGFSYTPSLTLFKNGVGNNISTYSGFETFGYFKRIGYDIYWQKFTGFGASDEVIFDANEIETNQSHWVSDLKTTNASVNLYIKLLGKYRLNDYFFQPHMTTKSKIGLYAMVSAGQRRISDTKGFIHPDFVDKYPDIDGFEVNQKNIDAGIGVSGTVFVLQRLYVSMSWAFGVNTTWSDNIINEQSYKKVDPLFSQMNIKIFAGYQGKAFKIEGLLVLDLDDNSLNDTYYIGYASTIVTGKISYTLPNYKKNT